MVVFLDPDIELRLDILHFKVRVTPDSWIFFQKFHSSHLLRNLLTPRNLKTHAAYMLFFEGFFGKIGRLVRGILDERTIPLPQPFFLVPWEHQLNRFNFTKLAKYAEEHLLSHFRTQVSYIEVTH